MMMDTALNITEPKYPENVQSPRVHPQRFALWIVIASLIMLFAGLTSAYLVRKGAGNWVEFSMPQAFTVSAVLILLSSVTIHWAYLAFKREQLTAYRIALGSTLLLSIGFLVSQYVGWQRLQEIGIYISGNPSGSFVYVISFVHIAHVLVGMLLLMMTFLRALFVFRNPANFLIYRTDANKKIRIELLATYWHFVDLLWLYLLIFFMAIG